MARPEGGDRLHEQPSLGQRDAPLAAFGVPADALAISAQRELLGGDLVGLARRYGRLGHACPNLRPRARRRRGVPGSSSPSQR
jgi:hypothetical protein